MASAIHKISNPDQAMLFLALDPKLQGKGLTFNTHDQTIIVPQGTTPMQAGFTVVDPNFTYCIEESTKNEATTLQLRSITGTTAIFRAVFMDQNTRAYTVASGKKTYRTTTTDDISIRSVSQKPQPHFSDDTAIQETRLDPQSDKTAQHKEYPIKRFFSKIWECFVRALTAIFCCKCKPNQAINTPTK